MTNYSTLENHTFKLHQSFHTCRL